MKFEFNIDKKCTIWVKETHYVEADNKEQAEEKIIALFRANNDDTFSHQEILHETLEDLTVSENDGWATAELMNDKGDKIADNTITIHHFEDWVNYMLIVSNYSAYELNNFEEHYQNLLTHEYNSNNFINYIKNQKHGNYN